MRYVMEVHRLPIDFLTSITNPFLTDVWGCGSITVKMVAEATPNPEHYDPDDDSQLWSAAQHAGRVKYLASAAIDPIDIDVGVPCLGYHNRRVLDGHHRLCAAVYLGHKTILCRVQGEIDSSWPIED